MRKFLFCLLGCLCMTNAVAMDVSLNDIINKMLSESNDLKKADANVARAQAALKAANANRWFKIDASGTYMNMVNIKEPRHSVSVNLPPELGGLISGIIEDSYPDAEFPTSFEIPDNIFMGSLSITQPIYTFGKIGHAVDSVRSAIKMSETSREITRRAVRYSAADMYWTAKMTDEIVVLAKQDLKNAENAKSKLTSAGRANRSNLVQIESDIASKEINVSDAEFNRDTAHRMLKILSGIDVDEELVLTDEFPTEFPEMTMKKLKSTPEWDALDQQIKMYESNASAQRANNYPTLAATGSYTYMTMANDIGHVFDKSGNQSAYWGLSLQMPIFNGGLNRANAMAEVMNAEAARQDLDKSRKIVSEQYRNAIQEYNHWRSNLSRLQEARDLAAKAYTFSQERFASGQTSAIELAEVAHGLYQLDTGLLSAKYKIIMAGESVKKLGE